MTRYATIFQKILFEPVTLDELKLFLKIDHTADDETLDRTRKAARQWVELYTSRNWARKAVTYAIRGASGIVKVKGDVFISLTNQAGDPVTTIKTVVFDGVEVYADLDVDTIYHLTVEDGMQAPPEAITEAIKKLASLYYFERESTGSGTKDLKTLLMPFKSFLFV